MPRAKYQVVEPSEKKACEVCGEVKDIPVSLGSICTECYNHLVDIQKENIADDDL